MTQKWKDRESLGKQGKFRVGDLIQLSAYGKNSEQNSNSHFDGEELGLIIEIGGRSSAGTGFGDTRKYPILVQWINRPNKNIAKRFFFRELKLKRT